MLKFGFIGFGQVGGNFADVAKTYHYPSMAINTANVDLNVLKHLDKDDKVHLIGYEGAGRDRSVGLEAFLEHEDTIRERIYEPFKDCHVVFPVFALGGGTGSGMVSPAIKMLVELYEEKVVAPIVFMPGQKESPRAKMNALEAFSELSLIEEIGATFIIDNNSVLTRNAKMPLKEKYRKTKEQLVGLLDYFNKKTETESSISNLDKMDLLTVLSERGAATLSRFGIGKEHIETPELMEEKMLRSWEQSFLSVNTHKNISKTAFVVELPSEMTTDLSIDSIFQQTNKPLEIFSGIFEENDAKIYSLATGLSFPNHLLKELEEDVQNNEKRILETLDKARTQSFAVKSSWTDALKRKRKIKV